MRVRVFKIGVIFMFILLAFFLANLQLIRGKKLRELSDKNRIRLLSQEGARGKIFDRNGNIIVGSKLSYDVGILPQDKKDLEEVLSAVAKILDTTPQRLNERFSNNLVSSFTPVIIVTNIERKKAIALEELKAEYKGIVIRPRPIRDYIYGRLASHLIGYLNEIDRWRLTKLDDYGYRTKDIVGFGGVEERYDYYLRQEEGGLSFEVDNLGKFVRVLGFRPPQNGKDLYLSLDLRIQKIVEQYLGQRRGAVIIMHPYTGEIIAMASRPDFDPRQIIQKSGEYLPAIFKNRNAPLVNRAISGLYPPGSVFKPIVAAAALENSKINYYTTFDCSGSTRIGNRRFKCWNVHHKQNLVKALVNSCDTFFYKTGLLTGAQALHDWALRFGLGKPTGVDLPYELGGFVPSPLWRKIYRLQNWFDGDTANFSIGQGELMVTPLQMTRMMAVFANKSFLIKPYVVKAVSEHDISALNKKTYKIRLKQSTLNYIREGLRGVVHDSSGTAHVLASVGIKMAGKTGTVQVSSGQPHGWFLGFIPFEKPKFVICVFLENVGSGQVSCILTRQILEAMKKEGLI